jgi:hypothetical protein
MGDLHVGLTQRGSAAGRRVGDELRVRGHRVPGGPGEEENRRNGSQGDDTYGDPGDDTHDDSHDK